MFWKGVLGYLPVNVVQALAGFGAIVVFTRLLSPAQYGDYALAFSVTSVVSTCLFTWLESAGTQIHLLHEDNPSVPPRAHVAVVCPHIDATLARLQEHGFSVARRREHWNEPRALATAPGGHRVGLMQAPPRAWPSHPPQSL